MAKTIDQLQSEAAELKEKRLLMGLSAKDIADRGGINQGNYSRMERGMLNCDKALTLVRNMYKDWLIDQEKKHKEQLKYIKSLA